jgi:hypothetical protein
MAHSAATISSRRPAPETFGYLAAASRLLRAAGQSSS